MVNLLQVDIALETSRSKHDDLLIDHRVRDVECPLRDLHLRTAHIKWPVGGGTDRNRQPEASRNSTVQSRLDCTQQLHEIRVVLDLTLESLNACVLHGITTAMRRPQLLDGPLAALGLVGTADNFNRLTRPLALKAADRSAAYFLVRHLLSVPRDRSLRERNRRRVRPAAGPLGRRAAAPCLRRTGRPSSGTFKRMICAASGCSRAHART